jgi:hypothetical protein
MQNSHTSVSSLDVGNEVLPVLLTNGTERLWR